MFYLIYVYHHIIRCSICQNIGCCLSNLWAGMFAKVFVSSNISINITILVTTFIAGWHSLHNVYVHLLFSCLCYGIRYSMLYYKKYQTTYAIQYTLHFHVFKWHDIPTSLIICFVFENVLLYNVRHNIICFKLGIHCIYLYMKNTSEMLNTLNIVQTI